MAESDEDGCEPKADLSGLIKVKGISRRSVFKWTSALTAAAVLPSLFQPSLARAEAVTVSDPGLSKFLLSHQAEHLKVKELDHWIISVRDAQITLGTLVFYLKRPEPFFAGLQPPELLELAQAAKWFQASAARIFGAEKFNYVAAMMGAPYVHMEALPRYSHDQKFAGRTWADKSWPGAPTLVDLTPTVSELDAITKAYREQG